MTGLVFTFFSDFLSPADQKRKYKRQKVIKPPCRGRRRLDDTRPAFAPGHCWRTFRTLAVPTWRWTAPQRASTRCWSRRSRSAWSPATTTSSSRTWSVGALSRWRANLTTRLLLFRPLRVAMYFTHYVMLFRLWFRMVAAQHHIQKLKMHVHRLVNV